MDLNCEICKIVMKKGTHYEHKNGHKNSWRYDECPKCHSKIYNSNPNFQEILVKEYQKKK